MAAGWVLGAPVVHVVHHRPGTALASLAMRVNPDVIAETHPYIATGQFIHKFGVPKQEAMEQARRYFDEALAASDNPHSEVFVAFVAMNHLTSLELAFNLIFFADALPLFYDQATVAKTQQTGVLYLWMDPYLAGISERNHRPLDTEEANWPQKEEVYCYFKRKSEPTVSPQQLANIWRTSAARIVELDAECRAKLWEWLKGQQFSEEEICTVSNAAGTAGTPGTPGTPGMPVAPTTFTIAGCSSPRLTTRRTCVPFLSGTPAAGCWAMTAPGATVSE